MRSGSAPIATARCARSALQAVTNPALRNAARAATPRRLQTLRDEHVRPVQADHQRQPGAAIAAVTPPGTTQWPCMTVALISKGDRAAPSTSRQ